MHQESRREKESKLESTLATKVEALLKRKDRHANRTEREKERLQQQKEKEVSTRQRNQEQSGRWSEEMKRNEELMVRLKYYTETATQQQTTNAL